ncbi:HIT domain-containing protein [Streptomyces sp. NBC_00161]|uniref:HIT family protein n=1 Tax=Streptomyces sp. NBC_00161 TaxID=2975671 RepID=UPI0032481700
MTSSPTLAGPPELAAGRWPEQFEEHMAGIGCPMCGNDFDAQDIGWGILLRRGEVANAYLWRSGQIRGYCVLIYRDAHVAEPTQLPDAGAAAFSRETLALGRAIEAYYRPLKINYCTLGNVLPHLHTHAIPRYAAGVDPGPGGPCVSSEKLNRTRRPPVRMNKLVTSAGAIVAVGGPAEVTLSPSRIGDLAPPSSSTESGDDRR